MKCYNITPIVVLYFCKYLKVMMNNSYILNKLTNFKNTNSQLEILKRVSPFKTNFFFKKICKYISSVSGFVHKGRAKRDIKKLLGRVLHSQSQYNIYYNIWLNDMSNLCEIFCRFLDENKLSFWIGNARGCQRYHVDMVPFRLLLTYTGQGTELLPNSAANRSAFYQGKPNSEIIIDKSARKFINKWDIAVFRGGRNGILHRTPDSALHNQSSILMRLDNSSFLEDINRLNYNKK